MRVKNAVPKPNMAMSANDHLKLIACATNPISGGPIKNPKNPMVETVASAVLADMVFERPAIPYTIGTTDDTPNPTRKKPVVAVARYGKATAVISPVVINTPLSCSIGFTPIFVTIQSPRNRPKAIVLVKARYPKVVNDTGADTTFLK